MVQKVILVEAVPSVLQVIKEKKAREVLMELLGYKENVDKEASQGV